MGARLLAVGLRLEELPEPRAIPDGAIPEPAIDLGDVVQMPNEAARRFSTCAVICCSRKIFQLFLREQMLPRFGLQEAILDDDTGDDLGVTLSQHP